MGQYLTKFEAWRTASFAQDDAALAPVGWTQRPLGTFGMVTARGAQPKGATKIYGWSSRSVGFLYATAPALTTWDAIDADANRAQAEVLVGARGTVEVAVRQQSGLATYYYAKFLSGTVYLYKTVTGTDTLLGSSAVTADASGLYYLRVRANGSAISAKCWGRDAAEPASPQVSVTDSAITAAGAVGVRNGVVEFFSVGTNGDTAPRAMSLPEANAALVAAMNSGKPVLLTCDIEVPGFTGSTTVAGRVFRRYSNVPFNSGTVGPFAGEVYNARVNGIPAVERDMNDLGGIVKIGKADVVLANGDGALDELFRMRLFRMQAVCRIGLPRWAWYDLLPYHQGVIQDVSDNAGKAVVIAIDGAARELDGDVTLATSTTGPNAGKPIPQQVGANRNITPTLTDATTLRYQFSRIGGVDASAVRDRGVLLTPTAITLIAFNATTDWLESGAAHNLLVDDPVVFSGSPPAPLVNGSNYFVKTTPSSVLFTVASTRGGATIDLTGATGGITAVATLQPFVYSLSGGGIELARKPGGQVTMDLNTGATANFNDYLIMASFPVAKSTNSYDFTPVSANIYVRERQSRLSVIEAMAASGVPVTFSRSGAMSWRPINFATIEATFTEADCFGAPRLTKTLQPTTGRVGEPNWTVQSPTDLAGSVTAANVALYGLPQYYLITGLGIDYQQGLWWGGLVDDAALYRDTLADKSVGGIAATNVLTGTGYTTLNTNEGRQRAAGVYEVTVAFKSMLLDCGDVVKLTHRRHFFKDVTNEVDVSPERPATAIGAQRQPSLAVVTKIVDDPARSRQTLTLYRPMPTLFPAS